MGPEIGPCVSSSSGKLEVFSRKKTCSRRAFQAGDRLVASCRATIVRNNQKAARMRNPDSDEEKHLIEKLQKVEALFARTTYPGERQAAQDALERIRRRLAELEKVEKLIEFRFSLPDGWSRSLFIALLCRYGLKPYRYSGQRRTTVMVKVAASFVDEVLWPEFRELNATLRSHLDSVTNRIIRDAIHGGDMVIEQRPGQEPTASEERTTSSASSQHI